MLRILVLVIAIGASGLTASLISSMVSGPAEPPAAVEVAKVPMEEILVASTELPAGKVLVEGDLHWRSWPADAVSPGFIVRHAKPDAIASLKGAVIRNHFVSGEPIREEKLSSGSSSLLAALLPSGKRAIAIRVSAESTAGGFILPHDRVDVIQTLPSRAAGQGGNLSRTLLTNIKVLAVDQQADGEGKAVVGETVTLELDPMQAEVVATGQASGVLALALRSSADRHEEVVSRTGSSIRILRGGRMEFVNLQ